MEKVQIIYQLVENIATTTLQENNKYHVKNNYYKRKVREGLEIRSTSKKDHLTRNKYFLTNRKNKTKSNSVLKIFQVPTEVIIGK